MSTVSASMAEPTRRWSVHWSVTAARGVRRRSVGTPTSWRAGSAKRRAAFAQGRPWGREHACPTRWSSGRDRTASSARTCSPTPAGTCAAGGGARGRAGRCAPASSRSRASSTTVFSSFYPLGVASPAMRELDARGPRPALAPRSRSLVAHPTPDGTLAVLSPDPERTAAPLDAFAPGDGDAWRSLYGAAGSASARPCSRRSSARSRRCAAAPGCVARARPAGLLRLRAARDAAGAAAGRRRSSPARAPAAAGRQRAARRLRPESPGSGSTAWSSRARATGRLSGSRGRAGRLSAALVRRLEARGGALACGERGDADRRLGRPCTRGAHGATPRDRRDAGGARRRRRAAALPRAARRGALARPAARALRRFEYDQGTVRVVWALTARSRGSRSR